MYFIFNGEVAEAIFIIGTILVLGIVWFAYCRDTFYARTAWVITLSFIVYMASFLWYKFASADISGHVETESGYALVASIHGMISLWATVQACYVFYVAKGAFAQGQNYFKDHKTQTLTLAISWPLALLTGLLM